MSKNIAYIHDISLTYDGGAEIATRTIVKTGRALGYDIQVIDVDNPPTPELCNYDLIILSNIWRFWPAVMGFIMEAIRTVPYVKYEHDYDGLASYIQTDSTRDGYHRVDYAEKIYRNSVLNVFQSADHKRTYEESFGISGICMPPMIEVDFFKANGIERKPNTALVGSPNKCNPRAINDYITATPGNEG